MHQLPDTAIVNEDQASYTVIGLSAAILIASFMPWANIWLISITGQQAALGQLCVAGAIIVFVIVMALRNDLVTPETARAAIGVGGAAIAALAIIDFVRVWDDTGTDSGGLRASARPGIGLWVTLAAGLGLLALALLPGQADDD